MSGWVIPHRVGSWRSVARRVRQRATSRSRLPRYVWRVGALLALVALLLTACGPTATTTDRAAQPAQPSAADFAARAKLLRDQMALLEGAQRHKVLEQAIDWYLARMSLDDELGQMILVACSCGTGPVYTNDLAYMAERQHIGGIIFFANNLATIAQTQQTVNTLQARAPIPLFVGTDQEGGWVSRISQFFGWFPAARDLGNSGDPQVAYNAGRRAGKDLQELGINVDFAPVVDVPVAGGGFWGPWRTFSDDPKQVARYAGAFMAGLHSAGEMSGLKHYPGIGSVAQDPHAALPVVTRSLNQLRQTELYPYQQLIPQGPDMIMATDVLMSAVDPNNPAEMSPTLINGILRRQLGYDGVVITDSLWMGGIIARWSPAEAAVLAVLAGADIVMAAWDSASTRAVLSALRTALAQGSLTRARVAQSARRIIKLKIQYGLLPIPPQLFADPHLTTP
jgi:beta-N-acetylhexosaminidase